LTPSLPKIFKLNRTYSPIIISKTTIALFKCNRNLGLGDLVSGEFVVS
jgi:hypothetical protein